MSSPPGCWRPVTGYRLSLPDAFVATAASIVSGAIAERIKMWAFFAFALVLTAIIYPIVGSWHWGQGWLYEQGFVDFAGSTIVHSTGGWAALAGLPVIGPRLGKFRKDGSVKSTPPSNVLVVGDHHRRHRRGDLHRGYQGVGEGQDRRCGRRDPRPPGVRHLGNPGGQHRGRAHARGVRRRGLATDG